MQASGKAGYIELHTDSAKGPLLSKRFLPGGTSSLAYEYYTAVVDDPGGTHSLFVVFKAADGTPGTLGALNWIDFYGNGVARPHPEPHGLLASYYASVNLSGPAFVREEPLIAHHWQNDAPFTGFPADNFSVVWTGYLIPPSNGAYRFLLPVQNGTAELYLDGKLVANSAETNAVPVTLAAQVPYTLKCTYKHAIGAAALNLKWTTGTEATIIPEKYLVPALSSVLGLSNSSTSAEKVFMYPNPAREKLMISSANASIRKVIIQNLQGHTLLQFQDEIQESAALDISTLLNGLYLVKITTENGEAVKKLVVGK